MKPKAKFMMSLAPHIKIILDEEAAKRRITIQELIRAVIIPSYYQKRKNKK